MNTEARRSGTNKLRLENDIEEYNNRMDKSSQIYFIEDEETKTGCTDSLVRIVVQMHSKSTAFMAYFPRYYPFYAPELFLESTTPIVFNRRENQNQVLKLPIDGITRQVELNILGKNWSPVFTLD